MSLVHRWRWSALIIGATLCMSGCGAKTPLEPVNRSPVVQSLQAFPTTIGPGDSAIVVCLAIDVDGDTLGFDWFSDCRLTKRGQNQYDYTMRTREHTIVVYPGNCVRAPLDTGWVSCSVHDRRGGAAYSETIRIIIQQ